MLDSIYLCAVITWAVALARVDFREHRLPDRLTLPAIPIALGILAVKRPENLGFAVTAAVVAEFEMGFDSSARTRAGIRFLA
jgi:prepilin signal peptidase PulO-like enzyme (type II secretory pathway)